MDDFETPYDDGVEVEFINCEICNKSIRGAALYKLHLTSPAHTKNEDALVAEGKIPRQYRPAFEDIIQYLEYLNLDEPIIGLNFLFEVPSDAADLSIQYNCTLCNLQSNLTDTVQHVIGRKHRLKYLEKKRPDLINWDPKLHQNISGKLVRAKAEIAERQDGRAKPKLLPDRMKRLPVQRSSIQGGPKIGQGSSFVSNMGPITPKFGSYSTDSGRQMSDDYVQERYEDTFTTTRAPLAESEIITGYKQDDDLNYPVYDRKGSGDFSNVGHQDEDRRPYGHSQREELYTDVFQKRAVQKDVLKEFYTEELRREQLAKAQTWPDDLDSHRYEHTRRPREFELGANQSNYPASLNGKNSDAIYKLTKHYRHGVSVERPDEALSSLGPSRVIPSRPQDFSGKLPDIPDPFMRFLKGGPSHEDPKGKKRKSRFSDATTGELQAAHKMFADEYGPPDSKFSSPRPEIRELKTQQRDPPLGFKQTQTYQEPLPQSSKSTGNVFEKLKNIEIENEEEANFLKEQLCNVLREVKARKAEKAAQTRKAVTMKDYSNLRPVTQQHTVDRYGRPPSQSLGIRRAEEPYVDPSQESYDGQMLDEDFQQHELPVLPEGRNSTRMNYKDVKRWPSNNHPQHAPGFDMPAPFPETFQEPVRPRDYQSSDNFSDYQTSTSRLPMELGPRMNRPPQYSRSLDKITSTLLELVKRK